MSIGKTSHSLGYKVKFLLEASVELGHLFAGEACSFADTGVGYAIPVELWCDAVIGVER